MTETLERRVLFLGHAAERTGPPIILLELLRWIRANTDIEVGVALKEGGPLLEDYRSLGPVWVLRDWLPPGPTDLAWRALWKLHLGAGADRLRLARMRWPGRDIGDWPVVWVNSAGSASLLPLLPVTPRRVVAHVHELSVGLDYHLQPDIRELLFSQADRVVTVADAVSRLVLDMGLAEPDRVHRVHGGIVVDPPPGRRSPKRAELGIPEDAVVVGSSGLRHWRKGPDLFVSLVRLLCSGPGIGDNLYFMWVGGQPDEPGSRAARSDLERLGLCDRVIWVDHQDQPRDWFRLLDIFVLTAREDAFPLVCLEAASVGCPIVCFTSGGMPEFVRDDAGVVVRYPDLAAMAGAVQRLVRDEALRRQLGMAARERVRTEHDVGLMALHIERQLEMVLRR